MSPLNRLVILCRCNGTLAWDAPLVRDALELDAAPEMFERLSGDEIHRFADRLSAGDVDAAVVACCADPALLAEVAGAAGLEPDDLRVINAREQCFWPHTEPAAANSKAARLLRAAAVERAPTPRPPESLVRVGPTVLIATDSTAGLALARRLADVARPIVVLDDRSAAFDREVVPPLPWKTTWGRLERVEGSLGAFRATVARVQPIDLDRCVHCRRCVPVCHTSAITDALRLRPELCDRCGDCLDACRDVGAIVIPREGRETLRADQVVVVTSGAGGPGPRRTGHHVLAHATPEAVDALAWQVFSLIGEFRKPQSVAYDREICAGGAAGHEACGRCIPACPYEAIARDPRNPLRVAVDHAACEGCGACVAVCPTSALSWTDPTPAAAGRRLRALLAPLAGRTEAPVVAFHCSEKGAAAFHDAGRLRRAYPASVVPVPAACLRHVSEADILEALALGAAGVALVGCATCPHGERGLLDARLDFVRTVVDAFGLDGRRVALFAGDGLETIERLAAFAGELAPTPLAFVDDRATTPGSREAWARAVRALIDATGREPGRTRVPAAAAHAYPDVQSTGCTLCRSCVNVCPTHAFRFDEARQALELRQVACVNCGLCAEACPEHVITVRPEIFLTRAALEHRVVAQDEPVKCLKCGTAFANRRAVEAIEAKLLGIAALADTFGGARRNLLRMCQNCRAVAAVEEMQKGWEP
jgi:ferredoxin